MGQMAAQHRTSGRPAGAGSMGPEWGQRGTSVERSGGGWGGRERHRTDSTGQIAHIDTRSIRDRPGIEPVSTRESAAGIDLGSDASVTQPPRSSCCMAWHRPGRCSTIGTGSAHLDIRSSRPDIGRFMDRSRDEPVSRRSIRYRHSNTAGRQRAIRRSTRTERTDPGSTPQSTSGRTTIDHSTLNDGRPMRVHCTHRHGHYHCTIRGVVAHPNVNIK